MARWFRFYADAMRNPKVARLADKDFRFWMELLSVASENDGRIPPLDDLKHLLKRRLDHLKGGIDRLISGGLIDRLDDGYAPHDWNEYQYKSDTSTDRVAKFRRSRNVSVTPPDTETDTDSSLAKAKGASADPDKAFWATGKAYLAEAGVSDPGKMIGMWCRDYGQVETARAITEAQLARAVEPVSYVQRVLKGSKKNDDMAGFIC